MGYADLIERLQTLPATKQAEVFDFIEFLANRAETLSQRGPTLGQSSLAELLQHPMRIPDFRPLSREEANAR
jgi:hypothetical protein